MEHNRNEKDVERQSAQAQQSEQHAVDKIQESALMTPLTCADQTRRTWYKRQIKWIFFRRAAGDASLRTRGGIFQKTNTRGSISKQYNI